VQPHWLRAMLSSYARLGRERAFILYVALLSMTTATFYAFLGGAPIVLGSYGVKPDGIGYYIMCVPGAYIVGNYLASHMAHRTGERMMMDIGQGCTLGGIALMVALALGGVNTPLAFSLPLMLVGIGHGLLVPPALGGTIGLVPALAGSAAAVAGLMQQMTGAVGGFAVGLFRHEGALNLGLLMLGFALCGAFAQWLLHRRPSKAGEVSR